MNAKDYNDTEYYLGEGVTRHEVLAWMLAESFPGIDNQMKVRDETGKSALMKCKACR